MFYLSWNSWKEPLLFPHDDFHSVLITYRLLIKSTYADSVQNEDHIHQIRYAMQTTKYSEMFISTYHQHIPLAKTNAATVAPTAHHPLFPPTLSLASLPIPFVGLALPALLVELDPAPVVVAGFVALATLKPAPLFACFPTFSWKY